MKDLIWKKQGKGDDTDPAIMEFLAGEDVELDQELILFDLQASGRSKLLAARKTMGIPGQEPGAKSAGIQ